MSTPRPQYDAIDTIRHLGYSEREAAFLYTVAVYSGYFLRRQFTFFIQRERGNIATHFLRKAKRRAHVRELPCGPGRSLYQLRAKSLYRVVGQKDSQNCRTKGTREIRRRLIMLDYVLAHLGKEEFLDSEPSRHGFFARFGLRPEILASAAHLGDLLPVTVRGTGSRPSVCFTFIDEGQRSTARFERFLNAHDKLLCRLLDFAVIYVATTPQNFEHARRLFDRNFPSTIGLQLPGSLSTSASLPSLLPRASFVTELMTYTYPPALNPDPGYDTGQDVRGACTFKPLRFTEIEDDAV
jgi:hypothetical protein